MTGPANGTGGSTRRAPQQPTRHAPQQAPQPGGRRAQRADNAQRSDDVQVPPLVRAGQLAVLALVLTPILLVLSGVAVLVVMLLIVALA